MKLIALAILSIVLMSVAAPATAKKPLNDDVFDPCVLDLGFAEIWICGPRKR